MSVTLESRFGVPENFIRANTRNKCSQDLAQIITELAIILYPDEELEVYLLPTEDGSYIDIVKIVSGTAITVSTVGVFAFQILTYIDSHKEHIHSERMQVIDDTSKCFALKQQLKELNGSYDIDNISEEKINKVCGSLKLKKLKNDRYKALIEDDMVSSDETILKNHEKQIVLQKKVKRIDFEKHIEVLLEEEYSKEDYEGIIELISPILRQKREGKGIPWKGTFYGEDVNEKGVNILSNGEEVNFYMQDPDFKKQIENHEVKFTSGDNMRVKFEIRGEIVGDEIQHKAIYVKNVINFNEDVIEHKIRHSSTKNIASEDQLPLFDTNKEA